MPKTNKKKKTDDDEDWEPTGKKKKEVSKKKNKYAGESCFIHIMDTNENLTKLPSLESWNKLLEAARIRKDENVIQLDPQLTTDGSNECPSIYYHLKCRNAYTHWKNLDRLSKVSVFISILLLQENFQVISDKRGM